MSEFEHEELTPQQRRVQQLVRGLPLPAARAEFRQQLENDFVSGAIDRHQPRTGSVASLSFWSRHRMARWAVPVAAAAAIVLMVGLLNRGAAWEVAEGFGQARIDGELVSLADYAQVRQLLYPGCTLELEPGAELQLYHPGNLLIEVVGEGKLVVPSAPGRWFGRRIEGEAHSGIVRVVTGPEFEGAELVMKTRDGEVEVASTSFTIMCFDDVTCVCVYDGDVYVKDVDGNRDVISGGGRKTMFADGRAPEIAEIRSDERDALAQLRQVAVGVLSN